MIGGMKIYASGKGNKHIARMRSIQLRLMEATKISMGGHKLQPIIWGVRKIVQRNEALRLEDALINHHIDNYLKKVPFMVHYRKSVRLSMCVSDIDMSKVQKAERDRIKKLKQGVANNRGKYWDIRKLALLESVKNVTKEVNKYKEYERQKRKEKRDNRGLVEKCRSERLRRGETYF